jgi:hypothetical protein
MAQPVRSRRWLPFFVVLACLAVTGVVLPIVYNLNQQLRPEQLAEARARWLEYGPKDYDLEYTLQIDRDLTLERYAVLVRGGKVVFAAGDGEVYRVPSDLGAVSGPSAVGMVSGEKKPCGVDAVFDRIQAVLDGSVGAARRNLIVAVFDPRDGHPRRFVYRVRGTSEREEWVLRLRPAGALVGP